MGRQKAEEKKGPEHEELFCQTKEFGILPKSLKGVFMDNDYRYPCIYVLENHFRGRGESGLKSKKLESRLFLSSK